MVKGEGYRKRFPAARIWGALLVGMALVFGGLFEAGAASNPLEQLRDQEIRRTIRVKVGHSRILRFRFPVARILVGDPDVADIPDIRVIETGPAGERVLREFAIIGQSPGVTSLTIWGEKARPITYTIVVEADVSLLKEKLYQVLPKEKIAVQPAGDSVVLSGEVSSQVAQATALALALPFVGGKKEKLINLMHIGGVQQVMVEVRIAEINRNVGNRMGVNFTVMSHSGNFGVSQIGGLSVVEKLSRSFFGTGVDQKIAPSLTALAGWKAGGLLWTAFFDVLKEHGLGRLLAEPNLVTISGHEASFLAGGEFPVPRASSTGTPDVEFKPFGVALKFTPTVLDDRKIALKISPEVSEIDFTIALVVGNVLVPGVKTRRMTTLVEVREGQTLAIAGLLSDTHRGAIKKFPILGDIPILGALFRSSDFQKNETELVALVTPHLVKPLPPRGAQLPTDSYIEPDDYEFYLLGILEGRPKKQKNPPARPTKALPSGFGPQPVE